MTPPPAMEYVCTGCGARAPASSPWRCPRSAEGQDVDHVLTRRFAPEDLGPLDPSGENPFLRFRQLLHPWHLARSLGLPEGAYEKLVGELQQRIIQIAGVGFATTPSAPCPDLARELGMEGGQVWIKDETGAVAGSHKARHLLPVLLQLGVLEAAAEAATAGPRPPLAIASCGNAALAAATLAHAAGRELLVFVPESAPAPILARIEELGGEITICARESGRPGDPGYGRFQEALAGGAQAFCCQGPDCALNIEGGSTLIWELVARLEQQSVQLDELIIQVGGGALAAACMRGLEEASSVGLLSGPLPRIHVVQTRGAAPLARAHARVLDVLARKSAAQDPLPVHAVDEILQAAARQRSRFMWPWETEPHSLATGILDDETYDWLAVLRGLLLTGGRAPTVSERTLEQAWKIGREATGSAVSPTGTAGLAGLLELRRQGLVEPSACVGIIFTGS